jgi:hypothetical protein
VKFGDPRVRNPDGIEQLLASQFRDIAVDEIKLTQRLTPEALATLWYEQYLLSDGDRWRMEREFIAATEAMADADGTLELPGLLRFVIATRR